MKFRQVIITASVALSFLIGTTPTITAAPQRRRRRRRSLESKNSQASVTATNPTTTKSVLAAQTGTGCFLKTPPQDTGYYYLVVNDINPVTTLFEERPGRNAGTVSTANFTDGTGRQETVIITLSDPSMEGDGITYKVSQYPSQKGVVTLDSWSDGQGYDPCDREWNNGCSIFIDEL